MICKNCANIFDDDLTECPECGTSIKRGSPVKTPAFSQEDIDNLVLAALSEKEEPVSKNDDFEDIFSYTEEQMAEVENSIKISEESTVEGEETSEKSDEEVQEPAGNEETSEPAEAEEQLQKESQKKEQPLTERVIVRKEPAKLKKMSKKEKGAFNFIVSLMVVLFIAMIAIAGISLSTDAFEKDGDSMKAIALSGLTAAETAELEDYLSKIAIVAHDGYDREKEVIVDVMAYLRPQDAGGLYQRFYGSVDITANKADPNGRFMNENGDFSYYALETEKVDEILATFGFSSNHNVNEKDFYCYGDKCYFTNISDPGFSDSIVAAVKSSKRIQNGSYYVECSYYDTEAANDSDSYFEVYIILDKVEDTETEGIQWAVSRISHKAIFDSSGIMVEDDSGENELSYSIETKTIEAVTEDGELYGRYVLEYPVFNGESKGETAVNNLFADLVNNYTAKAESADEDYQNYIDKGGNKEDLPYATYVVARVTYNRNGYISIVEGVSEFKPYEEEKTTHPLFREDETEEEEEVENTYVELPERSIEGYIFEVETGEFLSKHEVINVEYQTVQQILYRIYNGYEYESLLNENVEDTEEVPKDTEGMGKAFYESASAMGYSGYVFCYVNPKGYTENIVIPYETENFFNEDFSKKTIAIQTQE